MPVADIGDEATATREITREDIDAYAGLTGDDNPLHADEAYAEDGFFDGIVAHSLFGAGVISAALADLPGDIVYDSQEFDFEAPVRPGDTVRARVQVVDELGGERVKVVTIAEVGEGDEARTVISGSAVVLSIEHDPQQR